MFRYSGYVPQAKYRPGNTYGVTSHRVLLDPCIHMSPRSVLNNIHPEHCTVIYFMHLKNSLFRLVMISIFYM